jgi:predicted transcriptional regulator
MSDADHILISLEPRYAEGILERTKLVELRRRAMNVKVGATVWLYAKLPVGSIVGRATVRANHVLAPSTLWRKFGSVSGISRAEFFDYFDGVPLGTALELSDCRRLASSFTLESLRQFQHSFQPPQFFTRLSVGTPILSAMLEPA